MSVTTDGRPFVFVSYASLNRDRVIGIVDALEANGVATWFDRSDIPGGTSYGPEIVAGIKNATALLLMCSEASLASRNVRQEIQLAWRHETPILPILLEPLVFPDDVSYWLEGAQWIEVLDQPAETWLDSVLRALALMGYGGLAAAGPAASSTGPLIKLPPNNLPIDQAAIVGRDRELRQISSLLEPGRLVTLAGTGGSGKTRLAVQAAFNHGPAFPDGIWFIDASPATTATELAELIAGVLDIQENQAEPLSRSIATALHTSRTLLVMDNLEQVDAAATLLDELLSESSVSILATSRAPLKASNELVIPVAPLQLPDLQPDTPTSVIARNPAVQLFVERARSVKPDFQLSDGNAHEVAAICARLDGLPLAIELAAARSRLLHPAMLLQRLESSLALASRGAARSARQQTLRDSIAWSYDLLPETEQMVFRRLAVFTGGASVEMAERVMTRTDEGLSEDMVIDAIEELIDHSLLTIDASHGAGDGARIRMLETIREFAAEALTQAGEFELTGRAHAHCLLDLAHETAPELESGQQSVALSSLTADQQNMVAALRFLATSSETEDHELSLDMAGSLWRFWWMRGAFSEGLRSTDASLETGAALDSVDRAKALNGAGILAFSLGDLSRSRDYHTAALDLCTRIGATDELARSLDSLGIVHVVSGNVNDGIAAFTSALAMYQRAGDRRGEAVALDHLAGAHQAADDLEISYDYAEKSLAAWRSLHDQRGIGLALEQLGMTAMYRADYEDAARFLAEALSLAELQDDPIATGNALLNLASVQELNGDPDSAATLLDRAKALFETSGDLRSTAYAVYLQGHVARARGRLEESERLLESALESLTALGQQDAIALCLEALGGIAIDGGDAARGASLLGQAKRLREEFDLPVPQPRVAVIERDVTAARASLGAARFDEIYLGQG
ncbi:MAG: TIR domain-containing protein [Thermomicrobiales bacterium]|nr:TIR domain-containing protein [Thermomicrobiales bacterium]